MPASQPPSNITIPSDILTLPQEDRIQLAIAAIQKSGTKPNSNPIYSACQAAQHFDVPRSSLGHCLQGM
jgi:hypothetical protein